MRAEEQEIVISRDGESLPVLEVLTGRGFITGKSGSGKSFSTNVILEGLLDLGHSFLIIDTDGEYWGLKELYEVLHVGAGEQCDVKVDATDAATIVDVALEGHPVILDVSGFLRAEESNELVEAVITRLFRQEKQRKQPFLLVAEEIHEYIPEQGGLGDAGEVLIQIAKRGRKHGLGILGISQRPAAVDKDFITQCDWIAWHKLTWQNDTDVVGRILGDGPAEEVQEFDPGEAFLLTDWTSEVVRIRFKMKKTYDAGATPGMETPDPPPLKAVDAAILERFDAKPRPDPGGDDERAPESDGERGDGDIVEGERGDGDIVDADGSERSDARNGADAHGESLDTDVSGATDALDPDSIGAASDGTTAGGSDEAERAGSSGRSSRRTPGGSYSSRREERTTSTSDAGSSRRHSTDSSRRRSRSRNAGSRRRNRRGQDGPTGLTARSAKEQPDEEPVKFIVEFTSMLLYLLQTVVYAVTGAVLRASGAITDAVAKSGPPEPGAQFRRYTGRRAYVKYLIGLALVISAVITMLVLMQG